MVVVGYQRRIIVVVWGRLAVKTSPVVLGILILVPVAIKVPYPMAQLVILVIKMCVMEEYIKPVAVTVQVIM
jgi:hypothetical protein